MDQPNQFDLASLKESPRRQGDKQSVENQQTSNSEVIANAMSTAAPARRRSTSTRQGTTSIQFRLPFFIITLLTISLLGSTIFGSVQTNRTLTQQANERFAAQSKQVAKEVQLLLEKSVASLQTLAASEGLVEPIGELNTRYVNADGTPLTEEQILTQVQTLDEQWRNAAENDPLVAQTIAQSEDVNPLANQLYAYSEIFPENGEVFITDIYGATLAATDRLSDYYQADKDWWQATYNNGQGGIYISDIEFDESLQVSSLQISVPIIDDEEGTVVGVMRTTLDTTALQELINEQSFGQTGHAELFTATGEELIDGRSESGIGTGELPEATVQSFTLTEEGTATATDEAGGSLFFSYSRVKVTDTLPNWILLIRQDTSEALQAANQSLRNGLLITLAALAIAVVVAFFLSRSITQPLGELSEVANALAVGNLSRLSNVQSKDEFGQLSNAFNNAILELRQANARQEAEIARGQQLQNNIGEFLNVAMDIAQGDLTKRGQVSEDALGNVVDAINYMTEELGYVLRGVQDATQSVNQGATDMFSTTDSIAQSAEVQASEAQKAREDVQGIRSTMRQVSEEMTLSAESATQALRASREGQQAVVQTLEGMQDIRREVQAVSKRVKNLGDRSLEISEIVETISKISEQTNLLAVNAAIESSGAGEAGLRFAVVADQVRKLAEESAYAAERVSILIKTVQDEVQEVITGVETGTREVEEGYRVASQAGQRLEDIAKIVERSAELAQRISKATQDQVTRVEQVGQVVEQMAEISQASQSTVSQGRVAAEKLQQLATQLSDNLARFRLA